MQRIAQKYGLTAAILVILVLAALAMPSAASAAPQTEPVQAEYAVAVDTSSQNWKAVRLDNGQQPKSDDPRLINQTDGLVEFRAQDMGGNYIEAWTLEEVAGDWQIEQINGNKFYHFAVDATRAWIMNDRIMACSELERVSKGNKKCQTEPVQAEYAVAVDTSSQNWKAVRLDNGQQPKSDDPRLINQTDGLVEFRAQDMGGNYLEAWTLEEVAGDWQIEQINGNKFYHFAVDATRAWIMNDRIMACSELERVSKGNKKCPVTPLYLPLVKR